MFGSPITSSIVNGKAKQYPAWYTDAKIKGVFAPLYGSNPPTWGFDCVGLIKAVLWGWEGDINKSYGGAVYASNGVPDISADTMIGRCSEVSTDFNNISIGEFLWMKGHCGIYLGNGLAVESSPIWKNGVQITACNCSKSGYNSRYWTKHGKLPYVEYVASKATNDTKEVKSTVSIELTVLKIGSKGKQVKTLQRLLNAFGHKLSVDGIFGNNTYSALRSYQKSYKLEVDGICGGQSWKSLLK
jgi:peptidoglycan hydrolase-like protein with peptidoglycan-binding domain